METEQRSNAFLATERVGTLMRRYAVPCIISLLVAALYNIVDQIFIANTDYLGSYGNAANTVVYPLTVIALAIAVLIGDGCCAFVSISLGAQETRNAHRSVGSAILLCVISGVALMAIYLIFLEPIVTMFGGRVNDETFRQSKEYLFWIALGVPFYMFGQAMNPIIRSDGSPKFAMASTLAGALVNIILDLIFGQEQYAQIPMAVLGIVMKVFQIVISISIGLAAGCIPVVGYNIGAGRNDRAKSLFTLLLICEAVVGAVALFIVEVFPAQLISIFGAAGESEYYTLFAIRCFRTYLCMTILATVNKGTFIYLQALGQALTSTMLSMVRELIFGVGFALLLPRFWGLAGVMYSMPVSDVLTFLISCVCIYRTYKALNNPEKLLKTA